MSCLSGGVGKYAYTEKQNIPDVMNLFLMVKSTLKCFSFIKPSSRLYDGEKIVA